MDSGDSQELMDIIAFLMRAVFFAFLLFELRLLLRKPGDTGEAVKGMVGEGEEGKTGEAGDGESGEADSGDSGTLNEDDAGISWRSGPSEELMAQASTLIVMMAAMGMLMVMDSYREASLEVLVDVVMAVLVVVVIVCPKYYSMSLGEFHVRGSRLESGKFSGYSVSDMDGMRLITLEGTARNIFGVRFHERKYVLVFSTDGKSHGNSNGEPLHERVEALLRKLYN
jgi:hypothetical protein